VGYAGGTKENPTYHNLGDHTETLEIDYDPETIGYAQLLEVFWAEHDPTERSWSRQYKAIIFTHDEQQLRLASESRQRLQAKLGRTIHTEIVPYSRFYPAEDYHQKYYLRMNRRVLSQFQRAYPDAAGLMNSTAAARVNGFLGGHGTEQMLVRDIEGLGLSEAARAEIEELVRGRN
jgi:peptide-methionine (S)-S-oxide reductase